MKRMFSFLLAVVMVCSLCIVSTGSVNAEDNGTKVYFENSQSWNTVYAYVWGDASGEALGEWPGTLCVAEGESIFSAVIPEGSTLVIFNDNGTALQAKELTIPETDLPQIAKYSHTEVTDIQTIYHYAWEDYIVSDDSTTDEVQTDISALPEKSEGTNRYFFCMPEKLWIEGNPYTQTAGIYWWEGTDACESWPGHEAKPTGFENIYYYDVPQDVTTIIWNNFVNGGTDPDAEIYTADYKTITINTEFYYDYESELYPNGTESFDNMIYVLDPSQTEVNEYSGRSTFRGEWFYYYGNGEYGLAENKADTDVILTGDTVKTSELSPDTDNTPSTEPLKPSTNRYYFYMPKDEWQEENPYTEGVGIYWWEDSGCPDWPGYEAKYSGYDTVYYYDVPTDVTSVIWTCLVNGGDDTTAEVYIYDYKTEIINTEWYDPDENRFYPNGTDNFNNMIYVIDPNKTEVNEFTGKKTFYGEWFYYYGEGEYGLNLNMDDGPIYWGDTQDLEKVYRDNFGGFQTEPTVPGVQDSEVTDRPENTYRYFFFLPKNWTVNNPYSISAGIYWWNGSDSCDSWPGYRAKYTGIEGIYYYDVPADVTTIIWNNALDGGTEPDEDIYTHAYQTKNINTEYYDAGESVFYPDGTYNFDNMIYVIDLNKTEVNEFSGKSVFKGEWFYYYGNGEYGLAENKADAKAVYTSDTIDLDEVYFDEFSTVPVEPTEVVTEATVATDPVEVTEPAETTEVTKATEVTEATEPTEATPDSVKVLADNKTQIFVETDTDAELKVEEITSDKQIADIDLILVGEKVGKLYDITLTRDGAEVQPDGKVTVKIPADNAESKVYRVEENGTLTDMMAEYKDGFLVFTTERFSLYVVTEKALEPSTDDEPEAEYQVGDANKDGKINIKDATIIQKHLAKMLTLDETALVLADFDLNGKVNIKDATTIQKKIAGLI